MTGHQYRDLIAGYILHNYGGFGLVVYVEISLGKTVIGKGAIIGGNTWITRSVPPGAKVYKGNEH